MTTTAPERSHVAGWLALSLLALAVAAKVADIAATATSDPSSLAQSIAFAPLMLAWAGVGALIAARRPRNPVGWLLLGIAILGMTSEAGITYVELHLSRGSLTPSQGLIGWALAPLFGISGALVVLLLLFFPTGRLPSRRWRPALWLAIVGTVALTTSMYLSPGHFGPDNARVAVPSPIDFPGSATVKSIVDPFIPALAVAGLLGLLSVVFRYRGGGAVERQQMKTVLYGIVGLAVSLPAVGFSLSLVLGDSAMEVVGFVLSMVVYATLPVAIGVAVLRYRLFDVGRIVSRTAAYALVASALTLAYAAMVLVLGRLLPFGSDLAVAASTLLVAALFRPLVVRVRRVLDRRFHRSRYDAVRTVETFGARLRNEIDLAALTDELAAVAGSAIRPVTVSVWLRSDPQPEPAPAG